MRIGNSATALNLGEVVLTHGTARELRRQNIGRRHRILHRDVDADAADRRHRVRGISDAEQSRPRPALQPVDGDGEQLDVVPAFDVSDARLQDRRKRDDVGAERFKAFALTASYHLW